jgi:hypothetical protein
MTKSLDGFISTVTLGHCTGSGGCSKHADKGGNIWHAAGIVTTGREDGSGVSNSISSIIEIVALIVAGLIGLFVAYIVVSDILIPIIF